MIYIHINQLFVYIVNVVRFLHMELRIFQDNKLNLIYLFLSWP